MRASTLHLHSASQLARTIHHQPPKTMTGYMRYAAEHREIHKVLRRDFPVRTTVNYVEALDTDLWFLEMEAWNADLPHIIREPYSSAYAQYIDALPKHVMGCHWYNMVFAHLVGGNRTIIEAVSPVLPDNWMNTSEFLKQASREEIDGLRNAFEVEAQSWTEEERTACLLETPTAFQRATSLNALLFSG